MPNPTQALLGFGKFVAFLDDDGVVQFGWIGDPLARSLNEMPGRRDRLHEVLQGLIPGEGTDPKPAFPLDGMVWEPINLGSVIGVGFAWNPGGANDPLRLGLGAAANFGVGDQAIDLAVLARLIKIQSGNLTAEVPEVVFGGSIPVPDFLQSASLEGALPSPIQLSLTVNESATSDRTLDITKTNELAWDSARLAIFILQAWVRAQTTGGDTIFDRIDKHLFPMFGDPPGGPIGAFPLFGKKNMGEPADFDAWVDSAVSLDDNAQGPLTFLWHLRALLTGVDNPNFFDGSKYFPLDEVTTAGGPPTLDNSLGELPPDASGAFLGVEGDAQEKQLVLLLRNGPSRFTIPLAKNSGGTFTRPNLLDDPDDIDRFALPDWMSFSGINPGRLTIFNETLPSADSFGGPLKADLLLTKDEPVGYEIALPTSPALGLIFPATGDGPFPSLSPHEAVAEILPLVAGSAAPNEAQDIVAALHAALSASLRNQTPDAQAILAAIIEAAAPGADPGTLDIGGLFTLDLEAGGVVRTGVELDKVQDGFKDKPVRIGKAGLDAEFDLTNAGDPLQSFRMRLGDIRIDPSDPKANAEGIAGSLLGDMTDAPGFNLVVGWTSGGVMVEGGGRIAVQQTIGPLELSGLSVEVVDETALEIAVDAAFSLGPVTVTPYELGLRIPFSETAPTVFLHGLGLSMDAGGIRLAGHFGAMDGDYVGAAVVSVADFFELSAIGGYTRLEDESPSLFIFASLVAPLGGPPFLFVTGVAGGFGYNRLLPPPGPIAENPFMRVMRGEIPLGGGPSTALQTLGKEFLPSKGQHWIAAGLQFVSFGFIHGKLVVVVGFPKFSLQIVGSAAFGIDHVAYFEIEIQATADDESFQLTAGLSHNSYVIHPDIFSLHGQFALATWHGGKHAGDFVFSIGGYHGLFKVPEHYPTVHRVGVKATVYGFVRMSLDCFFATTPHAMMAGAAISLSAEFADIAAGLDVYIDVYIQWDPFHIRGRMSVVVWFVFMGRHEIGVHLEIHTPPLGGTATIDLALVSFDIEFGEKLGPTPRLDIWQFIENQLGVEADPWNGEGARVNALSTSDRAGLFRLDMLRGRTAKAEHKGDAQEGISPSSPIRVGAEFAFTVRTRLPVGAIKTFSGPFPAILSIGSIIDLPLCKNGDELVSKLEVSGSVGSKVGGAVRGLLDDAFPAAQFGAVFDAVQPDSFAKAQVGSVDPADAIIDLTEGLEFSYDPHFDPPEAEGWDILTTEEPSLGDERYPLPLGPPQRSLAIRSPKTQLLLGPGGWVFKAPGERQRRKPKRAEIVRQRIEARVAKPLELGMRSAVVERRTRLVRIAGPGFAVRPDRVPVVAPPASPIRRAEMREIGLRRIEPRVPGAPRRSVRTAAGVTRPVLREIDPPALQRAGDRNQARIEVRSGEATLLEMRGDNPVRGDLTLSGGQVVRAIFLGGQGQPVADLYLPANHSGAIPPRSRQAVFFGEGADVPVVSARTGRAEVAEPARAVEAVGVDQDAMLIALSPRSFAGHGCVIEALSAYPEPIEPLDGLNGFDLLRAVPTLRIHFPAVAANGTLVLCCESLVGEAGVAVDQIRWRTLDAELATLRTVTRPERVALTMAVTADEPWVLEVDLGVDWRLCGVAWRPQNQTETLDWLVTSASWDMTDDRRSDTEQPVNTSIDMDFEA